MGRESHREKGESKVTPAQQPAIQRTEEKTVEAEETMIEAPGGKQLNDVQAEVAPCGGWSEGRTIPHETQGRAGTRACRTL